VKQAVAGWRAGRWAVFTLVAVTVRAYYLWVLRAAGYGFDWKNSQGGYYNYLGRAFAHGRLALPIEPSRGLLALPNPWDPAVDDGLKMHDMALYNGRYYLYHGAAPAVMLFTPFCSGMATALLAQQVDVPRTVTDKVPMPPIVITIVRCGALSRWT